MDRITDTEMIVIDKLIKEAEDAERQLGSVLGVDDEVTIAMRNARDFLRGMSDAGCWCAFAKPEGKIDG